MKRNIFFMLVVLIFLLLITNATATTPNQDQRLYIAHQLDLVRALHNSANDVDRAVFLAKTTVTPGGSISGMLYGLTDEDGVFASAMVEAFTDDPAAGDSTAFKTITPVNRDGSYQLTDVPAGTYIVFAMAEGYIAKYYDNTTDYSQAKRILVNDGEDVYGIDFRMEKIASGSGSISGLVNNETTNEPIANANVHVFSNDFYYYYGWASTNRDGTYLIGGLGAGSYYATAWAEWYISEYYDNAELFENADLIPVADDQETANINFSLTKGATMSGTVLDKNGQPLPEVLVEAVTAFQDSSIFEDGKPGMGYYSYNSAFTDEQGHYTIFGLPTGTFYAHAIYWDGWNYGYGSEQWFNNAATFEEASPLHINVGDEVTGIDFVLSFEVPDGSISGKVTDMEGNPLPNVSVQAMTFLPEGMMRPSYYGYAVTDREGNYVITHLPDDLYIVSAWSQIGWQYISMYWPNTQNYENAQPVVVGDEPTIGIDFKLPISVGTASISGTVTSVEGNPLPWAYIQISPAEVTTDNGQIKSEVWAYASADSTGAYKVEQLPAGKYVAYASYWRELNMGQEWYDNAQSRETATVIELADKEVRNGVNFSLDVKPIYGALTGVVRDKATGAPLSGAYVEVTPYYAENNVAERLCAPFWFNNFYAITDENGSFAFDMVYESQYVIAAYAKGGFAYYDDVKSAAAATPVSVVGGQKTQVDFSLTIRQDGNGAITGTVYDDYGNPFEIAVVVAYPADDLSDDGNMYTTVTEKSGDYKLTGLPSGDYYVSSFASYGVAEFYDNAYDPSEATVVSVNDQSVDGINFNLSQVWMYDAGMEDGPRNGNNSGARVIGTVTNKNGSALEGAGVYVINESGQRVAYNRTQSDGSYEITGLMPGSYVMQAGKLGYKGAFNGNVPELSAAESIQLGNGTTQIDFMLGELPTDIDGDATRPTTVRLLGNYPNPFNPSTQIVFELPTHMQVTLRIYSITGVFIAELANQSFSAGRHSTSWNGQSAAGQPVSSGLYLYELRADKILKIGKMILMR